MWASSSPENLSLRRNREGPYGFPLEIRFTTTRWPYICCRRSQSVKHHLITGTYQKSTISCKMPNHPVLNRRVKNALFSQCESAKQIMMGTTKGASRKRVIWGQYYKTIVLINQVYNDNYITVQKLKPNGFFWGGGRGCGGKSKLSNVVNTSPTIDPTWVTNRGNYIAAATNWNLVYLGACSNPISEIFSNHFHQIEICMSKICS